MISSDPLRKYYPRIQLFFPLYCSLGRCTRALLSRKSYILFLHYPRQVSVGLSDSILSSKGGLFLKSNLSSFSFSTKGISSGEWRINIEHFLLFRPVPLPITLFPYSDTQTRSGIDWRKLWPPNERDRPLYTLAIRSIMALFRCRSGDENSVIFMVLVELPISIWGETFLFAPLSVKLNKFWNVRTLEFSSFASLTDPN